MLAGVFRRYSVTMSQACANELLAKFKPDEFLRLTIEGGVGCGGYTYKFEITNTQNEDDEVILNHGAKMVIDKESATICKGSLIDFTSNLVRRAFIVKDNPNAEMTCGCGGSFAPKQLVNVTQ